MKLDKFINRPVLSTVISILIVILGAIGLATVSGHCASYRIGKSHIYGCQCINRIELCNCPSGRADQRCRKHDVHDIYRHQHGRCLYRGIFQTRNRPRHGCCQRTKPCNESTGPIARRSNSYRCQYPETTDQFLADRRTCQLRWAI